MDTSRYSRQHLFPPIGKEGQAKLNQSRVLIVGMGALGTVLANHMVRAGVGHVRFVDRDFVELSNLQRQLLFDEQDVEQKLPKAVAAEQKLRLVNSDIEVQGLIGDVTASTIAEYASDVDLILDGTDNFSTRFVINDYAFKMGIPYVYGGAVSSRGMQATFIPGKTPCLRCLFEESGGATETCDTSGVIAPIVDMVASLQAVEGMKWLLGDQENIRQSLLTMDLWHHHRYELKLTKPKAGCLTCQREQYPSLAHSDEDQITTLCGRETVQMTPQTQQTAKQDLNEWAQHLEKVGRVEKTPFLIRCHVEDVTLVMFTDGRVLIQGTEDISRAKTIYARYIGM
ncbi:ThiF family adenylyltransferase [Caldalkalibacillus salinus]|uniref:ThiF family adenylyltransferase n=1 Tax=Caldalkalibacillus salinus TaxID=2803787 RepID=UPI001924B202|nr:ThiF family adenylyltransferase [Caldalkalibacillus salinus]